MSDFEVAGNHFKVACFTEVTSPTEINQFLKEKRPEICLVDAKIIISIRQIKVALLNALSLQKTNQMQCRTIYLEILRCLSPDGRLSGAFKNCAVTETTKSVIGISLSDSIPEIPGLGKQIPVDEFFDNHQPDINFISKIFMINDDMLKIYSYEDIIVTTLAVVASDLVRTHSS
ncbi:hypothetical protein TRFO_38993 [Tritrichomonas foetus]|uniref:Uncharacterized protein n=1 Tax=Tritrichomonas foetus TaxID=1144522 RepID=A0A1J4J810_9EUKA|nr:hypothetical protein TRFO_38993 [Tritrichomonas foetus]|eukprot:OHS94809.1 hypothetical protein TRFO_38993 [Tritrichomonas foetus]